MSAEKLSDTEHLRHPQRRKMQDRRFSLRQVAMRVGVEPAYLSKIERGYFAPPSEELICQVKQMPDDAMLRIVREVKDGHW